MRCEQQRIYGDANDGYQALVRLTIFIILLLILYYHITAGPSVMATCSPNNVPLSTDRTHDVDEGGDKTGNTDKGCDGGNEYPVIAPCPRCNDPSRHLPCIVIILSLL